ncbi:UNVERIFIED_CONTAM: hypothetical protein HDU68_009706 [Siphonaria sp. JEL0065]|nr:hypothetical protein HDU68_009706 [Siphonaria sp. JEL0065]
MLLLTVLASLVAVSNAAINVQYKSDYTGPPLPQPRLQLEQAFQPLPLPQQLFPSQPPFHRPTTPVTQLSHLPASTFLAPSLDTMDTTMS